MEVVHSMKLGWILRMVAAGMSALLTTVGVGLVFVMHLPMHSAIVAFFNPGGMLVDLIWPEGPHSGHLLAAFSPLFFVIADLVAWWLFVYFIVLAPFNWLWHRREGATK
jgi:hypothetical protein